LIDFRHTEYEEFLSVNYDCTGIAGLTFFKNITECNKEKTEFVKSLLNFNDRISFKLPEIQLAEDVLEQSAMRR
jgi:hypothetical protein